MLPPTNLIVPSQPMNLPMKLQTIDKGRQGSPEIRQRQIRRRTARVIRCDQCAKRKIKCNFVITETETRCQHCIKFDDSCSLMTRNLPIGTESKSRIIKRRRATTSDTCASTADEFFSDHEANAQSFFDVSLYGNLDGLVEMSDGQISPQKPNPILQSSIYHDLFTFENKSFEPRSTHLSNATSNVLNNLDYDQFADDESECKKSKFRGLKRTLSSVVEGKVSVSKRQRSSGVRPWKDAIPEINPDCWPNDGYILNCPTLFPSAENGPVTQPYERIDPLTTQTQCSSDLLTPHHRSSDFQPHELALLDTTHMYNVSESPSTCGLGYSSPCNAKMNHLNEPDIIECLLAGMNNNTPDTFNTSNTSNIIANQW